MNSSIPLATTEVIDLYALDFEYDGRFLSDFDCIICDFDFSGGAVVATAGATVTFNRASRNYGKIWSMTGIAYDSCVETTFDICKDPDKYEMILDRDDPSVFTLEEFRFLSKWLNRTDGLHKFRAISLEPDSDNVWYNVSFNVEKIKIREQIVGLRLHLISDSPYGFGDPEVTSVTITSDAVTLNREFLIRYKSDDVGEIYPDVRIVVKSAGNFTLTNTTNGSTFTIKNCTLNEIITVDRSTLMLSSSTNRNLLDGFNFKYFKLSNTLDSGDNYFKTSLPCVITISYAPIIKDAPN